MTWTWLWMACVVVAGLAWLGAWLFERWVARKLERAILERHATTMGLQTHEEESTEAIRARLTNVLRGERLFTEECLEAYIREMIPTIGHVVFDRPEPGMVRGAVFTRDWDPVPPAVVQRAERLAQEASPATTYVVLYSPRGGKPVAKA